MLNQGTLEPNRKLFPNNLSSNPSIQQLASCETELTNYHEFLLFRIRSSIVAQLPLVFSSRAESQGIQKRPLSVQNVHIGIQSQMNLDLLSGNSIQNSYLVHKVSSPFSRNPIPSFSRRREGGRERRRASERASEREETESARSAWNSFDL